MVFLGAGLFALVMPEFIRLVIGEKWLPMLWTFRLLLGYAAFDSFLALVNGLLIAVGKPEVLRNATLVQAAFFLPAVILGAHLAGIKGVAIAADGMLLVGALRLYRPLRRVVDFSIARLTLWPTVALAVALGAGFWIEVAARCTPACVVGLKLGLFLLLFGGFLFLVERADYVKGIRWMWRALRADTGGRR